MRRARLVLLVAPLAAATFLPPAAPLEVAQDDNSLSPATAVSVDPTLTIAPAFSVGRLCLPGSTCPS